MKIGYGNYAMPTLPLREAVPRLAEMGYEAIEVCGDGRWPTAPDKLSTAGRAELRGLFGDLGLEMPAVMLFLQLLAPAGPELEAQERLLREACALARDLSPRPEQPPVIASTLGHCSLSWEEALPQVEERALAFGAITGEEGCRLALEPHAGGMWDQPERVVQLMERVHSPSLGINFDISHFDVGGYPRVETIRALVPYAIHTHVKDGRMEDGQIRFSLPGEDGFDYAEYFREMARAGWTGPVVVEVSAQIFNRPDYDPWAAAHFCIETLRRARAAASQGE